MKVRRILPGAIAVTMLLVLLLLGARGDSSVADEHPHILSGFLYWNSGSFSGGFDNPPLGQLWIAAPLALFGVDYLFPADTHLLWARLPVILLTFCLALLMTRWAWGIGGVTSALTTLVMFSFEPNLLAHGHLATLDAPLAFLWWWTLWSFRRWLLGDKRAAVGFLLGFAVAVLTKFTGILLLPVCFVVGAITLRSVGGMGRVALLCIAAAVTTVLLSWLVYGFESAQWGVPHHLAEAIAGKLQHRQDGHFAYLAGRRSLHGFPEYNLMALVLKSPVPLLLLAACGLVLRWKQLPRVDRAILLVSPAALLVVSTWSGVHIGVRHLLPVYPGLLLCAAWGVAAVWQASRRGRVVAMSLAIWWVIGTTAVAPEWLAYFNVIAGGPAHGDRWLLDSNLDWGQDDQRLQAFLDREQQQGRHWLVNPPGEEPRTGNIVVNANELHGLLRMSDEPYLWLRRYTPQGYVGWSWKTWRLTLADFQRQAAAQPQDDAVQVEYAGALHRAGRSTEALAHLDRFAAAPSGAVVLAAMEIALDAGLLAQAAQWRQRAPATDRAEAPWQRAAYRFEVAQQLAAASTANDSANGYLQMGLLWAQTGALPRAMPYLEKAARLRPVDLDTQAAWVVGLGRSGRYAEAAAVASALPVAAALRQEYAVLSRAAQTRQELQLALVEGGSVDMQALRDLAQSEFEDGRADRAAAALIQLLRQQPDDRDALHLLGEIQVRSKLRVTAERLTPRSLRVPQTSQRSVAGRPGA